jgi:hypothetical protein
MTNNVENITRDDILIEIDYATRNAINEVLEDVK